MVSFRCIVVLTLVLLTSPLLAQGEAPTRNPAVVVVKGRRVSHSWRAGRIWVPSSELQPLLNLKPESLDLDLLKALEAKGGYLWEMRGDTFHAFRDPAQHVSVSGGRGGSVRTPAEASVARSPSSSSAQAGRLSYRVQQFTADTGYVRAYIQVINNGPGASDPSQMVCQFQDGFGKTFAVDRRPVPSLAPGDSQLFEIFSMFEEKDTSMTVTRDNVAVNFFSLSNPNANPTTRKEMRKQQRQGKERRGLDFNTQQKPFEFKPLP